MAEKRGRPGKNQQLVLQKKIHPYFEHNLSASFVSRRTGINIKTVCKYYNSWANEISKACKLDLITRQKEQTGQMILAWDGLIADLYDLLDVVKSEISNYIKKDKEVPKSLIDRHIHIVNSIFSLGDRKSSVAITPTLDETIDDAIRKRFPQLEPKK